MFDILGGDLFVLSTANIYNKYILYMKKSQSDIYKVIPAKWTCALVATLEPPEETH
jgi:hypothetical protein